MAETPLTEQQIKDGWIAHDGGPCPVDPDSKPGMMGWAKNAPGPYWYEPGLIRARDADWHHVGNPTPIIAYRPATPIKDERHG